MLVAHENMDISDSAEPTQGIYNNFSLDYECCIKLTDGEDEWIKQIVGSIVISSVPPNSSN